MALAMGPEYAWLVGKPNRKELWVLSRTETMRSDALREMEGKAAAEDMTEGSW